MFELVCGVCDCITVVSEETESGETPQFCPMCGSPVEAEDLQE
jgi:rRNA maturation endonuclease Nob1